MALMLSNANGQLDARKIEAGSPFYWAWSPDSQSMLLHVGGSIRESRQARLALKQRDGTETPKALARGPAWFQSPHYAPDGASILYAATVNAGEDTLIVADSQDNNARTVATYEGAVAFAWSPDSKYISTYTTIVDLGKRQAYKIPDVYITGWVGYEDK